MKPKPRRPSNLAELTTVGAVLKEERMKMGMTQVQVAQNFGISLKALRNLEQGIDSVGFSTVVRILRMFGKEIRVGDVVISPQPLPRSRPRKRKILETLKLIRPVLEKKFGIKKVALFGSCANDKATPKSDVDIAVEFSNPIDFTIIGQVVVFLETLLDGHKVDLVEFDKMVPEVLASAQEEFIYV